MHDGCADMLFSTVGQGALFIWMMAAGALMGIWYVLLAGVRRILQAGFWLTLCCDLAFGAGCAAIFILFLVSGNYGRIRLFAILAVLLGLWLFVLASSPLIRRAMRLLKCCISGIWVRVAQNRLIKIIFK